MKKHRSILSLLSVTALLLSLTACSGSSDKTPQTTAQQPQTTQAGQETDSPSSQQPAAGEVEIPYLAKQVQSGQLPAMQDRLPADPLVVEVPEIGVYGGNINHAYTGVSDFRNLNYFACVWEPLIRIDTEGNAHPNLLESWEYTGDDARTLTLKLRQGIKWSDGEPFTAEDITYFLDLFMTGEVSIEANGLQTYVTQTEMPDDYTAVLTLSSYYNIADSTTYEPIYGPAHYLKQFDPRENPDASWTDLNNALCNATISSSIVDLPTLTPWHITSYT